MSETLSENKARAEPRKKLKIYKNVKFPAARHGYYRCDNRTKDSSGDFI